MSKKLPTIVDIAKNCVKALKKGESAKHICESLDFIAFGHEYHFEDKTESFKATSVDYFFGEHEYVTVHNPEEQENAFITVTALTTSF